MADPSVAHSQVGSRLAWSGQGDENDDRPALVLLHGLTFDRTMWASALDELRAIDPDRRALAFDLPGHGTSAPQVSYSVESVAEAVHHAVNEVGLVAPVMVGHSLSAIVATVYASRYPASGVINVDQSLQTAPFSVLLQSMAEQLRGPGFVDVWPHILASMHIELLPEAAQVLLRSTCRPAQDLVLGYWQEPMERPAEDIEAMTAEGLAQISAAALPYYIIVSEEPESGYRQWVQDALPQASFAVWAGTGHFPHLAEPRRFAEALAATAQWPAEAPPSA